MSLSNPTFFLLQLLTFKQDIVRQQDIMRELNLSWLMLSNGYLFLGGGGGHSKKFRQGCSCHFFGFEISQFAIFFGLLKMRVIFWGLKE